MQRVFDTMTANALRLCDGRFSTIYRFDGELIPSEWPLPGNWGCDTDRLLVADCSRSMAKTI